MSKSDARKTKAVALKYQEESNAAPVVIASGYGTIAEKIVDIAEQKGIPVFRDDSAASLMCMLEVGRSIPPELYECIAAVYMQILQISGEIKHYQNEAKAPVHNANIDDLRDKISSMSREDKK
ncbi:MAG: EscU/YscU/HrcU family type III secretion system export apparatus switch protein [Oscillospiraceae bacterium]